MYGIIKQHDGYIDVVSVEDEGTTFSLYFPITENEKNSLKYISKELLQRGQGETILLVEDDPATRKAVLESLLYLNYTVLEAHNGEEALTLLSSGEEEVSLIVSDMVMPKMGGVSLFHAIRQKRLMTPVVLLTGHPLNEDLEKLRPLGLVDWLPKPPNLVKLSKTIAYILGY